ncbi:hypothetical protein CEXT_424841 [Caerostris extrusa]|uniref:Uncharacterized protein n=1 Tax=Caerostris extrusa TaxID=172846 RepID=A0AAV4W7K6_CAEEX|nr:hypothetical protein CEXT_424841 [Caerostris extrusa]
MWTPASTHTATATPINFISYINTLHEPTPSTELHQCESAAFDADGRPLSGRLYAEYMHGAVSDIEHTSNRYRVYEEEGLCPRSVLNRFLGDVQFAVCCLVREVYRSGVLVTGCALQALFLQLAYSLRLSRAMNHQKKGAQAEKHTLRLSGIKCWNLELKEPSSIR